MKCLFLIAAALFCAVELSDEERERVAAYKKEAVAENTRDISAAQKQLTAAQRLRDMGKIGEAKLRLSVLKNRTVQLRKATEEELFNEMRIRELEAKAAQLERERRALAEKAISEAGPLVIVRYGIVQNEIGITQMNLEIQNNTDGVIEAFEIEADFFNKFGEPVTKIDGSNRYTAHHKFSLRPHETKMLRPQLLFQGETARADVWISRVLMPDGSVWKQTKEQAEKTPYGLADVPLIE